MGGVHVIYAIIPHGIVLDDLDPNEFKYVYIGMTNDFKHRMSNHLSCVNNLEHKISKKLYNRLRYYGWDNFDKIVLMSGLSEEEAKEMEIQLIAKYNTFEKGMNSDPGGGGFLNGANHPQAEAINVYNNSTGDIISFSWSGDAAEYLGIKSHCIYSIFRLSSSSEQTYSPNHNAWFQFKKAYDNTPFVENMPTPGGKQSIATSGDKHHNAQAINVYNNSTNEIRTFLCIEDAAKHLDLGAKNITAVLSSSSASVQTYSPVHKTYFQIKYVDDETPFIKNMLSPSKKKSISFTGEKNSAAKPVCAFGSLFGAASDASNVFRFVCNTKQKGNFVKFLVNNDKYKDVVFRVTKEFYKRYKNTNVSITREMYDDFVNQTQ